MYFLAELLELKRKENIVSQLSFQHNINSFYKGGELNKHKTKKKALTLDEIILLLYINDGALNFNSRLEAILGTNIIFEQMARLGLKTHIRKLKQSTSLQDFENEILDRRI